MSDLRSRLIEAIAEELEADCNAEAALDAMLDILTEQADEWFYAWSNWMDPKSDPQFSGLIGVLRPVEEEP